MKKLILLLILGCITGFSALFADETEPLKGICSFEIPKSMDIRSTIFLSNRSSYSIANAKLYMANNGVETPIASVGFLSSQDSLKFDAPTLTSIVGLRGRRLVLRVKAKNSVTSQDTNLSISLDFYEEKHNLVVVLSNRQDGQSHAADVVYDDKPEPVAPKPVNHQVVNAASSAGATSVALDQLGDNVVAIKIPKNMNLKDKIFLVNRTPYIILQSIVVLVNNESLTHIGSATMLYPNETVKIEEFKNNNLAQFCGKTIAIKAKGYKQIGSKDGLSVDTSSSLDLNNLDSSLITYNFKASVKEDDHDLYISLLLDDKSGGLFDF